MNINYKFTLDDLVKCWEYPIALEYLLDILNGDYSLESAQLDLYASIGSKQDKRVKK